MTQIRPRNELLSSPYALVLVDGDEFKELPLQPGFGLVRWDKQVELPIILCTTREMNGMPDGALLFYIGGIYTV